MGDAPQRRLDAAEHDRHIAKRLAAALRIDDRGAVGPLAALAARRVAVVVAQPPVRRVAVDHGIHVAAGDAEEQVRPPQRRKRRRALPVRLCDDADPKPLSLQEPPDDRHAEARMVHIGIARDHDDVAGIPAKRRPSRRATWAGTARCRTGAPSRAGGRTAAGPRQCRIFEEYSCRTFTVRGRAVNGVAVSCSRDAAPKRGLYGISIRSNHTRSRGRACRRHPRLACDGFARKRWMAGTSPAMPGHDSRCSDLKGVPVYLYCVGSTRWVQMACGRVTFVRRMSASSPSSIPAADAIQGRGRNRAVGGEIAVQRIDIGGAGDALIGALAEHRKAVAAIDQKSIDGHPV